MTQIKTKDELIAYLQEEYDKHPELHNISWFREEREKYGKFKARWNQSGTECAVEIIAIPQFIERAKKEFPKCLMISETRPHLRQALKPTPLPWDFDTFEQWKDMRNMVLDNIRQAKKDECQYLIDLFENDLRSLGSLKGAEERYRQKKEREDAIEKARQMGIEICKERGTDNWVYYKDHHVGFGESDYQAQEFAIALYQYCIGDPQGIFEYNDTKEAVERGELERQKYLRKDGTMRMLHGKEKQRAEYIVECLARDKERLAMFPEKEKKAA